MTGRALRVAPADEAPVVFGDAQERAGDVGREQAGGLALGVLDRGFTGQAEMAAEPPDIGEIPRLPAIDDRRQLVGEDVLGTVEQAEHGVPFELPHVRGHVVDHLDLQDHVPFGDGQAREAALLQNAVLQRVEPRRIDVAFGGHRRLHQLGVVFWEPRGQEIEASLAALGADVRAPFGPTSHERAEAHQADDLTVGGVLEQTDGRPRPIERPQREVAAQQASELAFVEVVVPHERESRRRRRHRSENTRPPCAASSDRGTAPASRPGSPSWSGAADHRLGSHPKVTYFRAACTAGVAGRRPRGRDARHFRCGTGFAGTRRS